MKKGLTMTLLTVAVALMGYKAMSAAPTIGNIPDVIIGDAEDGSGSNVFVFEDAINLDTFVSDDTTSDGGILWSFQEASGRYNVNNKPQVGGDPNNPGAASLTVGVGDPADTTTLVTATFRSIAYSPVAGPNTAPPGAGVQDGRVMTLIASDGTTYSTQQFLVYVDAGGTDRLSGNVADVQVAEIQFDASNNGGWSSYDALPGISTVTWALNANGICIDATANGTNIAGWQSDANGTGPYDFVNLTQNAVYEARLHVTTNAAGGATPMWTMVYEQFVNAYGGDYAFYDNFGSANAPAPNGNFAGDYRVFFTPLPVATASWNASSLFTSQAAENGFRLQLRTLDVGLAGADPYGAASDVGQICWKSIEVLRYDLASLGATTTDYSVTDFTAAPNQFPGAPDPNAWTVQIFSQTPADQTVSFAGGNITITPQGNAWQNNATFGQLRPGDQNFGAGISDALLDNYPVPWLSDTLYNVVATITAPGAGDATNPPDFLRLGADVLSNESIAYNYVTTKYAVAGMPKTTPGAYNAFWFSHSVTDAPEAQTHRFRPRFEFGTANEFVDVTNTGGFRSTTFRYCATTLPRKVSL